ncbi:MAG TPA: MBL fold metallo-hydrolase, partial [Saprospiraceae bacterium]|nr:MBL fold metallo-hydrolase [Saprospiraceae bacterium]
GKIIGNHATEDLMNVLLPDAGKLQEEEAQFAFRHGYSKHSKPQPLFGVKDAELVLEMVTSYPMDEEIELFENIKIIFRNAGHILGASLIELFIAGTTQNKKIVFSGDLGRVEDPLMLPPYQIRNADILLIESTYGNRQNPMDEVEKELAEAINFTYNNHGCLIIPAFALGRTQNMIYYLNRLMETKAVPVLPIYIDSPMAISVSSLYEKHSHIHKLKVTRQDGKLISIFDSPNIHFCHTPESSKALNDMKDPAIIISASGMCTGGRILHHLYHRLGNKNDTILFAGYQAEGTRGRDILEGKPSVRIFGIDVSIQCSVKVINGLSAHADQGELITWLSHFASTPKMTFITHGEEAAAEALSEKIKSAYHWNCYVPEYLESFELFSSI